MIAERKERKHKRTKLPGQPKRSLSAYFICEFAMT